VCYASLTLKLQMPVYLLKTKHTNIHFLSRKLETKQYTQMTHFSDVNTCQNNTLTRNIHNVPGTQYANNVQAIVLIYSDSFYVSLIYTQ
jgi:hypothetical protein